MSDFNKSTLDLTTTPTSVNELYNQAIQCSCLDSIEKPHKNKGERGQQLENLLGLKKNNYLTDVSDGDLKSTTLGQTIALTQLGHCLTEIIDLNYEFDKSILSRKITNCVYVIFNKKNGSLLGIYKITRDTHPEHYIKIVEDYDYICKIIKKNYNNKQILNTINGPNKLLQIRTKASKNSKGEYLPLVYKNHQLKDKYMAFYLTSSFSKRLLKNNIK